MPTSSPSRTYDYGDKVASAVTVLVALTPSLSNGHIAFGSSPYWALLASGIAFLTLSLINTNGTGSPRLTWRLGGSLALQSVLLTVILTVTRLNDNSVFAAFPIVGRAMACLPRRIGVIFALALYAGIVAGAMAVGGKRLAIPFATIVLAGFIFVGVFVRNAVRESTARAEAERLSAKLKDANQQLQTQADQMEELVVIKERNRLAREIHDSLGHALTTIAVQLEAAGAVHATDPHFAVGAINKAHALAHEALAEVRRSVGTLRQQEQPPSLLERLRQLTVYDGQLTVSLSLLGEPRPLSSEIELGLFRAAQEGLTNVRRHALAKSVVLTLDFQNQTYVQQTVSDDGRGSTAAPAGFGLQGLRERAALLGGTLVAANRPEGGFMLELKVPG